MTNLEFENEFNILYDSITSMDAPGLDAYEISVFLTKAQLEIIKEYFGPINKYKASFEGSSKRRADLRELVNPYSATPIKWDAGISDQSYKVVLPNDLFLIVYEAAYYTPTGCEDLVKMEIVPTKYDELNNRMENPFRGPLKKSGMRLDMKSDTGNKQAELVSSELITKYQIRYIKYPSPIVLKDLGGISSEPLSIDGVVDEMKCELDTEVHREILDRAVELAMVAYKQEGLQAQVQLNQRNN